MARVHVTSEIGPLRTVLVHTPGRELVAVTPGNREDYLYDDIIDLELAEREHRRFVAVLERFAQGDEARTLLTELVARPDVREVLVTRALEVVPSDVLAKQLAALAPEQLVGLMIEGALEEAGPIARALNETGFALPPLPNLFFTRDVGIVIGEHSIIGSMRHGVRWTEELLVKALFRYHPCLENAGILYDGSEEKRNNYTLEGGDVHPIRPDLLLLGFSERSSPAALDHLCDLVFEHCGVKDVIVVVLPNERTAIHLDMIFSQLDRELCCVYPPHFVGPERLAVLHRRKKSKGVKEMPNFFAAMQAVDHPLEPVFCGGSDRSLQEREQWSSACNFFAVRPGLTVTYARNEATLRELEHAGVKTGSPQSLLTGEEGVERPTGITDGMVAGLPRFGEVVAGFGRALAPAVLLAHNAGFDWRFLAAEYALAGVPAPGGKPLCPVRLTRRLVPELRHRGLDHVAAFFGIENPARHRAFGDALATAYVLRALLGRARERGVETLEQLIEVHDRPRHKLRIADVGLRIGRPPVESAIRNPQSAIPS